MWMLICNTDILDAHYVHQEYGWNFDAWCVHQEYALPYLCHKYFPPKCLIHVGIIARCTCALQINKRSWMCSHVLHHLHVMKYIGLRHENWETHSININQTPSPTKTQLNKNKSKQHNMQKSKTKNKKTKKNKKNTNSYTCLILVLYFSYTWDFGKYKRSIRQV